VTRHRARHATPTHATPTHATPTHATPTHAFATTALPPCAIAVRAYTPSSGETPSPPRRQRRTRRTRPKVPPLSLFLDTETTVDHAQGLTFGSSRVATAAGVRLGEQLLRTDALPEEDRATLERYARERLEDADPPHRSRLRVLARRAYLDDIFWRVAYKGRGLVVGFNLPFDLARLAADWGEARGTSYAGGFSLVLSTYEKGGVTHEDRYRPRVAIKALDSKRALMGITRAREPDALDRIPEGGEGGRPDPAYTFRGHFLDLRTLAFALTNRGHSLRSACKAFGVAEDDAKGHAAEYGRVTSEHIAYNRRDVRVTQALYGKLREEYERHPIAVPMTQAYSPASIGKGYMEAMGIRPILERQPDFPKEVLGYAMAAYYGGRAECRIRGVPVPVVYLDFLSMYPTVCSLMGIWQLLTCERIEVENATEDVRQLLAGVTVERCLDPAAWRGFVGLVQLAPDGDILPVRAHYGGAAAWQIGVNPLTSAEPLWYTVPDAVACTLLTGKPPQVLRALRLVPRGRAKGLRPVSLRGQVPVDPYTQDFFRVVIEERHRLKARTDLAPEERKRLDDFLKVLANATSYGICAEFNRRDLPSGERRRVEVYGTWDDSFTTSVGAPEEPGAFNFPPIAACITGAARLLLALVERQVADRGGTYAMGDTDSMAVVAAADGCLVPCPGGPEHTADGEEAVRALSWAEVDAIRERLDALHPYDRTAVRDSLLKLEQENRDPVTGERRQLGCYAISAKRYCLFNLTEDGRPVLRKHSEHGLGHLLDPTNPPDTADADEEDAERTDWMRTLWEGLVTEALGHDHAWPDWLDRPALGRLAATSPEMLRPFATWNAGKPYAGQVKPFNFLLTAYVRPLGHPEGVDPARYHLVAPFESDPRKWERLGWRNLYDDTGATYRIRATASPYAVPGVVEVKTYRDVLSEYRVHPEAKSLGPDGQVCDRRTVGLLRRRPVTAAYVTHVGKESNRLEAVEAGLVHDPEEVYTEYEHPRHDAWAQVVVPVLKLMPLRTLQERTGMSRSQLQAIRNGHAEPRARHRDALMQAAGEYARGRLRKAGERAPTGDLEACAAWVAQRPRAS
jgi:hypothetical protein